MKRTLTTVVLVTGLVVALGVWMPDLHAQDGVRYLVKITNVTNAQSFTPVLAATHTSSVRMYLEGTAASPELRALAEEGNVAPLMARLADTAGVSDLATTSGLLTRGVTTDLEIGDGGTATRISLAAMLIPTNDAFVAINSRLPASGEVLVLYAYAYDAGTERNDELCASIPGPSFSECGGPGGGATVAGGEGAVTIHRGIQGVGDLEASRDWRNPVARITIRRVS